MRSKRSRVSQALMSELNRLWMVRAGFTTIQELSNRGNEEVTGY